MISKFKKFIETKGVTHITEEEEQLTFLLDGFYYLYVYEMSDPYYFRIILPNILNIEDVNGEAFNSLINDVNQKYKVAKATVSNNGKVWVSTEQFVYSHEEVDLLFERCLAVLKGVIDYFKEKTKQIKL